MYVNHFKKTTAWDHLGFDRQHPPVSHILGETVWFVLQNKLSKTKPPAYLQSHNQLYDLICEYVNDGSHVVNIIQNAYIRVLHPF